MYESFYGFRETPFSLLSDPAFLFLSEKHNRALTLLKYALIHRAGFAVLSGEIGSGKTTLIRYLLEHSKKGMTFGLVTNTHSSFGELLPWVLMSFGIKHQDKDRVECYHAFTDFIIGESAQKRRTVLIIDEAQNMSVDMLEELRLLSNINAEKNHVLQMILVGQPELRTTLRSAALAQLRQRVAIAHHLGRLDHRETYHYIRHRLRIAGTKVSPFRKDSYDTIFRHSVGIPRLINILCDTALVYAYGARRKTVDGALMGEVVRDLEASGLFESPSKGQIACNQDAGQTSDEAPHGRPPGAAPGAAGGAFKRSGG